MKGNRFFRKKGNVACLLVHGLTSSAEEMEGLSKFLHSEGYSVLGTLLKGHNTSVKYLSDTNWRDWYSSVERDFNFLRKKCSKIYVIGLSIGATLSIHLAANKGKEISGLVLLSPAIYYSNPLVKFTPLLKHFRKYSVKDYRKFYPGRKDAFFDIADEKAIANRIAYKKVPLASLASALKLIRVAKKEIKKIKAPTLIVHSLADHTIRPGSASFVYSHLRLEKENKALLYIKKSGHVITVDFDKKLVFSKIINFLKKIDLKQEKIKK